MSVGNIEKRLMKNLGQAIEDFRLIKNNDRILVALSGGKDSLVMLELLEKMRRKAPVHFELKVLTIQPGFEGFFTDKLEDFCRDRGYDYEVLERKINETVRDKCEDGKSICSFCARLRRGSIYKYAREKDFGKIALGHHREDLNETVLLNLFYNGRLASMPPLLRADENRLWVIRPLCYCNEDDIREYAHQQKLPITCCGCTVCGCESTDQKRFRIKQLISDLEKEIPGIRGSMMSASKYVDLPFLLDMDRFDPEQDNVKKRDGILIS